MIEAIKCVKCVKNKTQEAMEGSGNMYRPEDWKNSMPWLKKKFYLCAKCLQIITMDWIFDHVNSNGEIYYH